MATFEQVGRSLKVLANKVGENAITLVKEVAVAVDETVVLTTPIKSGTARRNWQVEIGSIAEGTLSEPDSPGSGAASALDQARAKISQYKGGSEINITNNLPYIERLNNGYSAQAPVGFVENSIQAGVEIVKKTRLLK